MNLEKIKSDLSYDPETGLLKWQNHKKKYLVGELAFMAENNEGYRQGVYLGNQYKAHRLIWFIYYGSWPKGQIDHINGNKSDNRIINLRDVSAKENRRNSKRQSNNTSGYSGVYFENSMNKWRSVIYIDRKRKHIGYSDTAEEAAILRKAAEQEYNFHENH